MNMRRRKQTWRKRKKDKEARKIFGKGKEEKKEKEKKKKRKKKPTREMLHGIRKSALVLALHIFSRVRDAGRPTAHHRAIALLSSPPSLASKERN